MGREPRASIILSDLDSIPDGGSVSSVTYIALRTMANEKDRLSAIERKSGEPFWWLLLPVCWVCWPFLFLIHILLKESLPDENRPQSSMEQIQKAVREHRLWA